MYCCRPHERLRQAARRDELRAQPTEHVYLLRISRALWQREVGRGNRTGGVSAKRVRALLDAHKFTSALSGERVTLETASLTRRNDAVPFDATTNCMLISKRECHARGRKRSR